MYLKFLKAEHAIDDLENSHLKVSKLSELNDPFECLPYDEEIPGEFEAFVYKLEKDKPFREKWLNYIAQIYKKRNDRRPQKHYKNSVLNNSEGLRLIHNNLTRYYEEGRLAADSISGICCFSQNLVYDQKNLLMWSHYAESHMGLVLEYSSNLFDIYKNLWSRCIEYTGSRIPVKLMDIRTKDQAKQVEKTSYNKSLEWKYENEMRFFIPWLLTVPGENNNDFRFVKFNPHSLKAVYLGLNCKKEHEEKVKKLMIEKYPNANLYKAKLHSRRYQLEFDPISIH